LCKNVNKNSIPLHFITCLEAYLPTQNAGFFIRLALRVFTVKETHAASPLIPFLELKSQTLSSREKSDDVFYDESSPVSAPSGVLLVHKYFSWSPRDRGKAN
jgi:hypothetical protein